MHVSQSDLLKSNLTQTLQVFNESKYQISRTIDYTVLKLKFVGDVFAYFQQYQCELTPFQNFVTQLTMIKLGNLESFALARRVFKMFKKTFSKSLRSNFDKRSLCDFNSEPFRKAFLNFALKDREDLQNQYSALYFKLTRLFTASMYEPAQKKVRVWNEYPSDERSPYVNPEVPSYNNAVVRSYRGPEVRSYNEHNVQSYQEPVMQSSRGHVLQSNYRPEEQLYNSSTTRSYSEPARQSYSGPEAQFYNGHSGQLYTAPVVQSYSSPEVSSYDELARQWYSPEAQFYNGHSGQSYTEPVVQSYCSPEVNSYDELARQSYSPEVQFYNGHSGQSYSEPVVQSYRSPNVNSYNESARQSSSSEVQSYSGNNGQSYQKPIVQSYSGPLVPSHNSPKVHSYNEPVVHLYDSPEEQLYSSPESSHFSYSEIPPNPAASLPVVHKKVDPKEKEIEDNNQIKHSNFASFTLAKLTEVEKGIKRAISLKEEILANTSNSGLVLWNSRINEVKFLNSTTDFDANESYAVELIGNNTFNFYGGLKQASNGREKQSLLNFNDRNMIPHSLPQFETKVNIVRVGKSRVAFGRSGGALHVYELNDKKITPENLIYKISGGINVQSICFSQVTQKITETFRRQDPFVNARINSIHFNDDWIAVAGGYRNAVAIKLTDRKCLPLVLSGYKTSVKVLKIYRSFLLSGTRDQQLLIWDRETLKPVFNINHNKPLESETLDLIPVEQGFYALFAKSKSIYYYDIRQAQSHDVFTCGRKIHNIMLDDGSLYATAENCFMKLYQEK